MACVNPLDGWRARELNENGKWPVVFNPRNGYEDQHLAIPCGKCVGCVQRKASDWGVRCTHECLSHAQNAFLTLTYSDANLPSDGRVQKAHIQKFIKGLRNQGHKIRYFAVGEYGEKTHRPHYHLLVFGKDFLDGALSLGKSWHSDVLHDTWEKGMVDLKPIMEPAACFYVAGYALKNYGKEDTFALMSRRPAIGKTISERFHLSWQTGMVVIDGNKRPVPRAYKNWFPLAFEDATQKTQEWLKGQDPGELRQKRRSQEINLVAKFKARKEKI